MFGDLTKIKSEGITQEQTDLIGKRQEVTVSIRREGRQNQILKRRKQNIVIQQEDNNQIKSPFQLKLVEFAKREYNIGQLKDLVDCINSQDLQKIHYGMIGIRKLLSTDKDPPIQQVIDANIVTKIIQFANQMEYQSLKSQSTWCLSNIASGSSLQTQSVVDKGGLKLFTELLKSENALVVEHAVWAIGNIAGDRAIYRDNLLSLGVLNTLCTLVTQYKNLKIVGQSCWCISNMIRCDPTPKFEQCKKVIPVLASMILKGEITDLSIIADSVWAFSYIVGYKKSRISFLIQTNIVPKLIQFLNINNKDIINSSIKILGNICYGDESHIEILIKYGFIQQANILFDKSKSIIKRQICWALSNIVATKESYVKIVFDHQQLILKIFEVLTTKQKFQLQLEAGMFFANAAEKGNALNLIQFYYKNGFMKTYLGFLTHQQNSMVEMALHGIESLLDMGQKLKQQNNGKSITMQALIQNKGIDLLEQAQLHPNNKIYKLTAKLLQRYFDIEDPLA